jgi:hypothetical protein
MARHAGSTGRHMDRVYGEPVKVQTREDGWPARFAWRGRRYMVRSVMEHWVVNREWWREPGPLPGRPELQFWRVEASVEASVEALSGRGAPPGTYELRQDLAAGTWMLCLVAD